MKQCGVQALVTMVTTLQILSLNRCNRTLIPCLIPCLAVIGAAKFVKKIKT